MGENADGALPSSRRAETAYRDSACVRIALLQKVETFEVPRAPVKRTGRSVRGEAMRDTDRCFMDGVADTLMLDVSFIARRSITAAAVYLCAMLSCDAARAAVLPINDHDSVRSAITAIALAR